MRRHCVQILLFTLALMLESMVAANLSAKDKAPDFTLRTIAGKSFTLSDNLKGSKAIVLNIWSTNCVPCKALIPYLVDISKTYSGKGVTVVGVTLDWNKEAVRSLMRELNINYTIAIDSGGKKLGDNYKIESIPATYIIDRSGNIHAARGGFPPTNKDAQKKAAARIENDIKALIAGK